MTVTGAGSCWATPSARGTAMPTRRIAWNGRPRARCSAASARAFSACAPRCRLTARRTSSTWSFTSPGAAAGCRSRRRACGARRGSTPISRPTLRRGRRLSERWTWGGGCGCVAEALIFSSRQTVPRTRGWAAQTKGESMKKLLIAVSLLAGCAMPPEQKQVMTTTRLGAGPTQAEITDAGKQTDNVLTYGMTYDHNRYSPLRQIDKSTIKRLVPVWNVSLQNDLGEQAQPMIYDGVMFVSNARWTVAIDALTGNVIWRTPVNYDPDTPRVVCCGVSNKGVAIFEGKVFRTTLDAYVVALDQHTGKEIWKQKVAEWKEGYSLTVAPLIANGVLITGCSGAEFGARCFLDGWDPATGKKLWRRYTTAGPGEKGHDTWEPRGTYLRGGASTWITGSYDPELDLVYWGTGNAGPWKP